MGSPIESRLLEALLSLPIERFQLHYGDQVFGEGHTLAFIERNVPLESYRVDLLIELDGDNKYKLAVECDGHEWHDRTKQQAAYDRSRDRDLLSRGVFTVRFTGSEIVHSAERCAADVYRALAMVADVAWLYAAGWSRGWDAGVESCVNPKPRGSL